MGLIFFLTAYVAMAVMTRYWIPSWIDRTLREVPSRLTTEEQTRYQAAKRQIRAAETTWTLWMLGSVWPLVYLAIGIGRVLGEIG